MTGERGDRGGDGGDGADAPTEEVAAQTVDDPGTRPTEVTLPARRYQRLIWQIRVFWVLLAAATVALAVTLPRSIAYRELMEENLTMRTALGDVDAHLAELDRLMLRLRLYDAEIRSIAEPTGDHGPIPLDAMSSAGLDALDTLDTLDEVAESRITSGLPMDFDARPAEAWAASVAARLARAVDRVAISEADVSLVVSELEEMRALERALPTTWPAVGIPSSGFGWRRSPFSRRWKFHSGLDIAADRGVPIRAPSDGTVVLAEYNAGYGRMIELDHGFGVTTIYAHCQSLRVGVGDFVQRGEVIATVGNTGQSTGPHLHFEVRQDGHPVDPMTYLDR